MIPKVYGPYDGVVDFVPDGDTVHVKLTIDHDEGFDLRLVANIYARVRVLGINAPELATARGKAARDYARSLLPVGAVVKVVSHGWDKYGGRVDGSIEFKFGSIMVDFAATMVGAGYAVEWDGKGPRP